LENELIFYDETERNIRYPDLDVVPGNTYYIRLYALESFENNEYDFAFYFFDPPSLNDLPDFSHRLDDAYENNDSDNNPYDIIDIKGQYLSTIGGLGVGLDEDWYSFKVDTPGQYEINLLYDHTEMYVSLGVYENTPAKLEPMALSTTAHDNQRVVVTIENTDSTYIISASAVRENGVYYDLKWDDYDESNDPPGMPWGYGFPSLSGGSGYVIDIPEEDSESEETSETSGGAPSWVIFILFITYIFGSNRIKSS
jgi:hypothetical protein